MAFFPCKRQIFEASSRSEPVDRKLKRPASRMKANLILDSIEKKLRRSTSGMELSCMLETKAQRLRLECEGKEIENVFAKREDSERPICNHLGKMLVAMHRDVGSHFKKSTIIQNLLESSLTKDFECRLSKVSESLNPEMSIKESIRVLKKIENLVIEAPQLYHSALCILFREMNSQNKMNYPLLRRIFRCLERWARQIPTLRSRIFLLFQHLRTFGIPYSAYAIVAKSELDHFTNVTSKDEDHYQDINEISRLAIALEGSVDGWFEHFGCDGTGMSLLSRYVRSRPLSSLLPEMLNSIRQPATFYRVLVGVCGLREIVRENGKEIILRCQYVKLIRSVMESISIARYVSGEILDPVDELVMMLIEQAKMTKCKRRPGENVTVSRIVKILLDYRDIIFESEGVIYLSLTRDFLMTSSLKVY
mmetsp:Transcript_22230/g.33123  ORF Transcript_22230/g.33123 Transcript_22230/m.33123 type:complete len:421 (+) Transcript_22230:409-1671(+)